MFRRFCLFMVEQVQKACAQLVWIITFKTREIKLIANDNTYKCVIIQNTRTCLHAFKWSFGYNNRTLLPYFQSFAISSCNNLENTRKHRKEACGRDVPSESTGEVYARTGMKLEACRGLYKVQSQGLSRDPTKSSR